MRNAILLTALLEFAILGCQRANQESSESRQVALSAPEVEDEVAPPFDGRVPLGPTQAEEPPRAHEEDNSSAIEFSPSDLSTSTEGTFPTVMVPLRGLGEEAAALAAAGIDLITWPEREVVPTTSQYIDDAGEGPAHARIVLQPREPLRDRWYALRARIDVEPGRHAARLHTRSRQDGYLVTATHAYSRFRVGSQPIVQRVDVTAAADGRAWVTVQFSERMRLDGDAVPVEVTVGGRALECRFANAEDARDEGGSLSFDLSCIGVPPGSHVQVRFSGVTPVSVRSSVVDDTVQYERGDALVSADGAEGGRELFEMDVSSIPEARIVSPGASDDLRVARWYTATARSTFGLDPRELSTSPVAR